MRTLCCVLFTTLLVASCNQAPSTEKSPTAINAVDGSAIKAHIQKLSSDEMEGRAPGGKGEELATAYIGDFFKSIGLKTQFQPVAFVGISSTASPLQLTSRRGRKELKYGDDFVAFSSRE